MSYLVLSLSGEIVAGEAWKHLADDATTKDIQNTLKATCDRVGCFLKGRVLRDVWQGKSYWVLEYREYVSVEYDENQGFSKEDIELALESFNTFKYFRIAKDDCPLVRKSQKPLGKIAGSLYCDRDGYPCISER